MHANIQINYYMQILFIFFNISGGRKNDGRCLYLLTVLGIQARKIYFFVENGKVVVFFVAGK